MYISSFFNYSIQHSILKVFHCEITVSVFFLLSDSSKVGEVRCYCNKPECVPQGYMCRGRGCFTELPSSANAPLSRAEHSGCLDESFKNRQCPAGYLCCDQDLCNHVDNPAMRNRLNKTLRGSIQSLSLSLSLCACLAYRSHHSCHVSIIAM